MSVLSYLDDLAGRLNVAENESYSIDASIDTLHRRLGHHFSSDDLKERFRFGSSTRRTMLPRAADYKSDVDYMIVFSNQYGYKPQTLISWLRRFAEIYYSSSEISQSNPTVVLSLNHIKFDLVPAYRSSGQLYIPAPNSSFEEWIYTDPLSLNPRLDQANQNNGYRLRRLIRLIKYWNAENNHIYDSFSLEGRLIGFSYYGDNNVKKMLYWAIESLYTNRFSLPSYKQARVEHAKRIIENVVDYEKGEMPYTAELEIKKLFPEL